MLTPIRRRNRYDWCRQHLRWTQRQLQGVMFTDESRFCIDMNDGRAKGSDVKGNVMLIVVVRWMTQVKKNSLHPPRYQGCYISSCREFYAEFNAKCCQSGNLCRNFVNMIL